MTEQQLAEIEQRTTPGPWYVAKVDVLPLPAATTLAVFPKGSHSHGYDGSPICLIAPQEHTNDTDRANADLIASIPALIAALRAERAENRQLREALGDIENKMAVIAQLRAGGGA